jgi:hypothetical protein
LTNWRRLWNKEWERCRKRNWRPFSNHYLTLTGRFHKIKEIFRAGSSVGRAPALQNFGSVHLTILLLTISRVSNWRVQEILNNYSQLHLRIKGGNDHDKSEMWYLWQGSRIAKKM